MANTIVQLPLDLTGTNPNNLVGSEEHLLVSISGFPYRIITMEHGGFYSKSLKVFDENFNRLRPNVDFIWTYRHKVLSERTGRDIASAIVFLNHDLEGSVFLQAQMVGGDLAYSFSVIDDYVTFYNTDPSHIPAIDDYIGTEPIWGPGELAEKRWGLDKYQPFNNELEKIVHAVTRGATPAEGNYREHVRDRYAEFMARFNDRLQRHIDDTDDPHEITPEQVGLDRIGNYPVATQAQTDLQTANDLLLTPSLVHSFINRTPTTTFNAHAARQDNPHELKPENVVPAILPKQTQTDKLADIHNVTDTVDNARNILFNGNLIDAGKFTELLRKNLDTSTFTQGIIEPNQITFGTATGQTLLRGNGTWADVLQMEPEYGKLEEYKIIWLSPQASVAVAMSFLTRSFNSLATWPIGTVAFFQVNTSYWEGVGNGSVLNTYAVQYAAGRTDTGWKQL